MHNKISFEPKTKKLKNLILAPFISKYRHRLSIGRIDPERAIVLPHLIMNKTANFVFFKNSKAGCTSIAHRMFEIDTGQKFDGEIHGARTGMYSGEAHWKLLNAALDDENVYKFTVVRDPISRAVSGFMDFVIDAKNPGARRHRAGFQSFGLQDNLSEHEKFDCFLDFLEHCNQYNSLYTDRHFRKQIINIGHNNVKYNKIGRMENLGADFISALDDAGVVHALTEGDLRNKANKTVTKKYTPSNSQTQRIERIYVDDFEAFGY